MTDKTKTVDPSTLLTAEDILRGGDEPALRAVEIPELPKGGRPGVVYLRQLSAGDVLDFIDVPDDKRNHALIALVAKAAVKADGAPLFTQDQAARLRDVSIGAFNRLAEAVSGMMTVVAGDAEGNA